MNALCVPRSTTRVNGMNAWILPEPRGSNLRFETPVMMQVGFLEEESIASVEDKLLTKRSLGSCTAYNTKCTGVL